jgi:hypothetical protein
MDTSDPRVPHLNEAQQRINNILLSDTFLLISGSGEVVSRNVPLQAVWPLLESAKLSLLPQLVTYCLDQRHQPEDPKAATSNSSEPGDIT